MTIEVPQEQWDELQRIVGVTHGHGDGEYLLVGLAQWGSRGNVDVRFVAARERPSIERATDRLAHDLDKIYDVLP